MAGKIRKKGGIREAWEYVKESRKYIYFAIFLFLAGCLAGWIFQGKLSGLDAMLKEVVDKIQGMGLVEIIWFIFQNNTMSSFFSLVTGVFFGLVPVFSSAFNGVILGYVFFNAVAEDGVFVFWKILPHGVFELPAIMIVMGLGLRLGMGFWENFFLRNKKDRFRVFLGLLATMIGLLGILLFFMGFFAMLLSVVKDSSMIASSLIVMAFGLVLSLPLIFMFFGEKKLRKVQKESFFLRVYNSFKAFVFIVLPLLAIAAIIEGSLIYFLR